MPRGMFTLRTSFIRYADFWDFRIHFIMAISPQVTKLTPIRKIPTSANPLHAREHYCKKLSPNMSKWLQKRRSSENLVYGRTSSYRKVFYTSYTGTRMYTHRYCTPSISIYIYQVPGTCFTCIWYRLTAMTALSDCRQPTSLLRNM